MNNLTAFIIVIISGFIHVIWNSRYKIADNRNQLFAGTRILNTIYLLPLCIFFYEPISSSAWIYIIASAIIHFLYFYFLIFMYENEDFSTVYPLSRGLGNLLTPILGTTLIQEIISKISLIGIIINLAGLLMLNLKNFKEIKNNISGKLLIFKNKGVNYSVLTGLTITSYSFVDKLGVESLNPIQYFYMYSILTMFLFNLLFLIKKENVYSSILTKKNFIEFSYVGLADSISYLLILYALTFVEVSYISPMRNSGIIISSFMGYFYLSEKLHKLRLYGSILIFIGIILTTIGIK